MPGQDCETFDINQLPDENGPALDEDLDNIDFQNYKGIYIDEEPGQKYTDPETGAHFEFKDVCRRLQRVMDKRK